MQDNNRPPRRKYGVAKLLGKSSSLELQINTHLARIPEKTYQEMKPVTDISNTLISDKPNDVTGNELNINIFKSTSSIMVPSMCKNQEYEIHNLNNQATEIFVPNIVSTLSENVKKINKEFLINKTENNFDSVTEVSTCPVHYSKDKRNCTENKNPNNGPHRRISVLILKKKSTGNIRQRLLDEDGFIQRVSCLCLNSEMTQVMLISRKKDATSFMIPGGGLEVAELETEAVAREAWEEAGVKGFVSQKIGLFETFHPSGFKKHRTTVYTFIVTSEEEDFPEAYLGRKRRWFSLEEAHRTLKIQKPLQSIYLDKFFSINDRKEDTFNFRPRIQHENILHSR